MGRSFAVGLALFVILGASLGACGTKGDDGDVYAIIDGWTSDVTGLDLSGVGAPASVYYANTKYKLKTGTGTVYWKSNSTIYYLVVDVTANSGQAAPLYGKGAQGDEKDYHVYFSGSVMTVSRAEPQPGIAPADSAAQLSADTITGVAEPGTLQEIQPN